MKLEKKCDACCRRNTSSVGEMLDKLEWPSLDARREQSSLVLLFHKILCGAMYIENDKVHDPCSQFENYQVIT